MARVVCFIFCCLVSIAVYEVVALKCRSGNQQTDMQFQKVFQICKKRNSGRDTNDNGSGSTDNSSSENSSESEDDMFDKKFFAKNNNNRSSYGQYSNNRRDNNRQTYDRRSNTGNSYSYNRTGGNWRDSQGNMRRMNDHQSTYSRYYNNKNNGFDDGGNQDDNSRREQACAIQCFFNEFNVVDQRGFPERNSVIRLMTQNVQDPELQDFIEESIIECFRYLETDSRKEKCDFSQNLFTCLADKGREKCEDWDD